MPGLTAVGAKIFFVHGKKILGNGGHPFFSAVAFRLGRLLLLRRFGAVLRGARHFDVG